LLGLPAAEPESAVSREVLIRIGVVVTVPDGMRSTVLEEFQREVGRVMEFPNVRLEWRRSADLLRTHESFERLVVVRFHGDCAPLVLCGWDSDGALGITHVSEGRILPFADIHCGRVVAVLAKRKMSGPPLMTDGMMGRALARVAAHEMYHILTGSEQHDRDGLAKAALSQNDLFEGAPEFGAMATARLTRSLMLPAEPVAVRASVK
jgi:hypothetical protein